MKCADCQTQLIPTDYKGIRIDECPNCRGRWFDRDELRRAKDRTDDDLRWLDFDPFLPAAASREMPSDGLLCPKDATPMRAITYEASGVVIHACGTCHGVWLHHDEFEKIVQYLEDTLSKESAAQLRQDAEKQLGQVFTGSEGVVSEFRDFRAVLRMLETRYAVEHPTLAERINNLYLWSPLK